MFETLCIRALAGQGLILIFYAHYKIWSYFSVETDLSFWCLLKVSSHRGWKHICQPLDNNWYDHPKTHIYYTTWTYIKSFLRIPSYMTYMSEKKTNNISWHPIKEHNIPHSSWWLLHNFHYILLKICYSWFQESITLEQVFETYDVSTCRSKSKRHKFQTFVAKLVQFTTIFSIIFTCICKILQNNKNPKINW